jgi:hypothetical protein
LHLAHIVDDRHFTVHQKDCGVQIVRMELKMNKYTTILVIIIIVLILTLMDSHIPFATFKVLLSERISIKVSVYDNGRGFSKMVFDNIKAMIECFRGI